MKLALLQTFLWCSCSVVVNVSLLLCRRLTYRLVGKVQILMELWKSKVVLLHLLLLMCLLRIYYQAGPLAPLEPQKTLPEMRLPPPADRLVVFLLEGLRMDTLFADNCSGAAYMRDIIMRQGLIGISTTSVPTLTRSAEVALFAGFNEMPSILPTDTFDTIFNRTLASDKGAVLSISDLSDLRLRLTKRACLDKLRNSTRLVMLVKLAEVGGASPLDMGYQKKLHNAQRHIRNAYELIEDTFNDSKTAYLYTSAHGLTYFGSHGGGSDDERETPFFLWGAGVKHMTQNITSDFVLHNGASLQLHRLQQIQLAPLMSALIGLPPPVNNLGILPQGYMKVSREYARKAIHLNALQLLSQAKAIIRCHEQGVFHKWLPKGKDLDLQQIAYYQHQMDHLIDMGWRSKALETSTLAIQVAQKSLKFYYGYYHIPLVVTTGLALLGWQFYLLVKLSQHSMDSQEKRVGYLTWYTIFLASLGLLLGEMVFLQWAPFPTVICLVVPFGVWCVTLAALPLKGDCIFEPLKHLRWIVAPAAVIIAALYCSCPLSLAYVLCVGFYNRRGWVHPSAKFLAWLALVLLLSGFLWSQKGMQVLMTTNYRVVLQAVSMLVVLVRPCVLNENHKWRVWLINGGILVVAAIEIFFKEMGKPIPIYLLAANWAYLVYAFASVPYSARTSPQSRLELIRFNLLTLHVLLSDSYVSLFAQGLLIEYQLGLEVHEECVEADEDVEIKVNGLLAPSKHLQLCYRFAVSILLYFYVSLFGTGHWLGSFTYLANSARLFLPDSCSALMPLLVLIHLLIPSIVILASVRALSSFGGQELRSIFSSLMLICNTVVLFFILFVPHNAHWPSAHPSVAHALLAQLTVVLLLACESMVTIFFRGLKMNRSSAAEAEIQSKRAMASCPTMISSNV
ncbi:GPI ethanolamine phosphate transferase 1 [Drosophila santomea]|uniref:GPI ethanolamine phosphate transferase 1 n=1 Tax=Drosophila santomea TaxID=129105 RepID=UPI001953B308|nr:GPI ethanolamine phosphate transferase 1 [Drosophila santomea]